MIAVIVFTDGRDGCLADTIASFAARVTATQPVVRWIHDDTGDPAHRRRLKRDYPGWRVIPDEPRARRAGFAGAIARAWETVVRADVDYVFHLEDDFTMNRPVHLDDLAAVLDHAPHLLQVALRRQPVNAAEFAAGGVVEMWPDEYEERSLVRVVTGRPDVQPGDLPEVERLAWLEHRLFFTTNPSLYRASLCAQGWPVVDRSEAEFARRCLADPDARFGYWGARDSGEAVEHIGNHRVGTGY